MPIFKNYAARKKEQERAGQPDVYQYDKLPETLRIQIIHIWRTAIGPYVQTGRAHFGPLPTSNSVWETICNKHARAIGRFFLGDQPHEDPFVQCQRHLMMADLDDALSLIELSFLLISVTCRHMDAYEQSQSNIKQDADDAIEELNHRFREHSVGYQFVGGQIVRVDSEYLHHETVRPALTLLQDVRFQGPTDEFLRAHEHYRKGNHQEAINEALKAFESTMKTICAKRRWPLKGTETASQLIQVILDKGLVPAYLQTQFAGLRQVLEAGVPTVRNKTSGHGAGETPIVVPDYLAAYALHVAASNIVLLVEAYKAKP